MAHVEPGDAHDETREQHERAQCRIWQSPAQLAETPRDAAERFVREAFGSDRDIRWGSEPGEFRFADGYWCYRIEFNGGHWQVSRMAKMTPKAKARARARREAQR